MRIIWRLNADWVGFTRSTSADTIGMQWITTSPTGLRLQFDVKNPSFECCCFFSERETILYTGWDPIVS